MSQLLYENLLIDANITSEAHVASSGSPVVVTPLVNVYDRSVMRDYQFTLAGTGITHTITLGFSNDQTISSLAVLGLGSNLLSSTPAFKLLDSGSSTIYSTSGTPTLVRTRKINGVTVYDYIFTFTAVPLVNKVQLLVVQPVSGGGEIGIIWAGKYFEFGVKPSSAKYGFLSAGNKVHSEGGQTYASSHNALMTANFTTVPEVETDFVANHIDLNYVSSISEPIIYLPLSGTGLCLYGTQSKNSTTKVIDKNTEWYMETTYQLREEL